MADILRQFAMIAATAISTAPIMKTVNAMSTIQSSPIEKAAAQHNWLFAVYFVLLLLIALMTWIVWKSGNRVQDEVRKDADARIATADSRAEEAKRGAAEARAESDKANAGLAKSNEKIAGLNAEAERAKTEQIRIETEANRKIEESRNEANVKIAEANKRAEELRQQNLFTESRLGREQDKRLDLEKSLAPRIVPVITTGNTSNIDPLKQYADTAVVLEFLPDAESKRAASSLVGALKAVGWKKIEVGANPELNSEGVAITTSREPGKSPFDAAAYKAGNALVRLLDDDNWHEVRLFPAQMKAPLPANTVRIVIGFKPDSYFFENSVLDSERQFKRSQPRDLATTSVTIAKKLLELSPKLPVRIVCAETKDNEPCSLAKKINDLLKDAGWDVSPDIQRANAGYMPPAITLLARNNPTVAPDPAFDTKVAKLLAERNSPAGALLLVLSSTFSLEVEVDKRTEIEYPFIGIWVGVAPKHDEQ